MKLNSKTIRNAMAAATVVLTLGSCARPHSSSDVGGGVRGIAHVIVIGVDGLSPLGIDDAETPVLDRLIREGAYTAKARGVMPTSSSSNWASMIMGAGPEQHGITSNGWQPGEFEIEPTVSGPGGMFPTVFSALRADDPGCTLACFHDWGGFGRLFERDLVDKIVDGDGPRDTVSQAVAYLAQAQPRFTFIHLDHVDHELHSHGFLSENYRHGVEEADRLIGIVIESIEASPLSGKTLVIITSDHGGEGTGHGGSTMNEIQIPWLAWGAGVKDGHRIESPVDTYDTAATVLYALGASPPHGWIAKPIVEAFE